MKKILTVLTVLAFSLILAVFAGAIDFSTALKNAKVIEPGDTVTERVYDDKVWTDTLESSSYDPMREIYYVIDLPTKGKFNITVNGAYWTNVTIEIYDSNGNKLNISDGLFFDPPVKKQSFDDFNSKTFNSGKYLLCIDIYERLISQSSYSDMEISFGFNGEHVAGNWVIIEEANCREGGIRAKYCKYCDKEMAREEIGLGDHDYGSWEVVREATEQADGLRVRECDICGEEDEDILEQLVHGKSTKKETVKATCTEDGANNKICKYCGEIVESEVILAKGHKVSKWKTTKEPTAIYGGIEEGKCSTCKEMVEREIPNDPTLPINPDEPVPYDDVEKDKWYYDTVLKVYINHYMIGPSSTKFNPNGKMTVAEAITVATRIFSANAGKKVKKLDVYLEENPIEQGESWYQPYVEYAVLNEIIKEDDFNSYNAPAKRAEMAYIFARCVEMEQINEIESIPDVEREEKYGEEIYYLYNAGILAGNDSLGTFTPDRDITRAEVSALIARITNLTDRVKK